MDHSSLYYVYSHIDLGTREVVYIGAGVAGRAWDLRKRSDEHKNWIISTLSKGADPKEYVIIGPRCLDQKLALEIEKTQLMDHIALCGKRPRFNRVAGKPMGWKSPYTWVDVAKRMWVEQGCSIGEIADVTDRSVPVVRSVLGLRLKARNRSRDQWYQVTLGNLDGVY